MEIGLWQPRDLVVQQMGENTERQPAWKPNNCYSCRQSSLGDRMVSSVKLGSQNIHLSLV